MTLAADRLRNDIPDVREAIKRESWNPTDTTRVVSMSRERFELWVIFCTVSCTCVCARYRSWRTAPFQGYRTIREMSSYLWNQPLDVGCFNIGCLQQQVRGIHTEIERLGALLCNRTTVPFMFQAENILTLRMAAHFLSGFPQPIPDSIRLALSS